MKLQFSLATLLACMTVVAVVFAFAVALPVYEQTILGMSLGSLNGESITNFEVSDSHPPTRWDITRRFAIWGTLAIAATLVTLWAIRRLKSRREKGPPVG